MGIPGPCGPNSEIYVDRGPEYGPDGGPIVDEDRFLEIWNLVFMQNIRGEGGAKDNYPILGDLPKKNIDTGMGLERVAYLLQGVDNLYEIDEVFPVLEAAAKMAGVTYGGGETDDPVAHEVDVRLRVVADHVRSSMMLIGDGVKPGNEARGYVVRRLLRRAVRSMRLLGVEEPGASGADADQPRSACRRAIPSWPAPTTASPTSPTPRSRPSARPCGRARRSSTRRWTRSRSAGGDRLVG